MNHPAQIRERLGLTQTQLASLLRLGDTGRKTVERWEREGRAPGAAGLALEALAAGWRPMGRQVTIALSSPLPLRRGMTDDQVIEALAVHHDVTIRRGDSVRLFEGTDSTDWLAHERAELVEHLRGLVFA